MTDAALVIFYLAIVWSAIRFLQWINGTIDRLYRSNKQSVVTNDTDDLYDTLHSRKKY